MQSLVSNARPPKSSLAEAEAETEGRRPAHREAGVIGVEGAAKKRRGGCGGVLSLDPKGVAGGKRSESEAGSAGAELVICRMEGDSTRRSARCSAPVQGMGARSREERAEAGWEGGGEGVDAERAPAEPASSEWDE